MCLLWQRHPPWQRRRIHGAMIATTRPARALANHGLHERVNSSASAAAPSRTGGSTSPPVEHSRPRAKASRRRGGEGTGGRPARQSRRRGLATEWRPATRPCLPRRGTGVWRGRGGACRAGAGARPFPAAALAVAVRPTSFLSPPTRRGYLTRVHGLRSACISYGL